MFGLELLGGLFVVSSKGSVCRTGVALTIVGDRLETVCSV